MRRFLKLTLVLTGVPALVLVLIPQLVVLGLFALVIPGLVMGVVPTVFLWTACFAALWFPLQTRLGDGAAAGVAGVTGALLLGLITAPGNLMAAATVRALDLPDVLPDEPLPLRGDLRLDLIGGATWEQDKALREGNLRPYSCDALCAAVLFQPDVTSVTINRDASDGALAPYARTYRLVDRADCEGRVVVRPKLGHRAEALGSSRDARSALESRILAELADTSCLVMEPAQAAYDQRVQEIWTGRSTSAGRAWSLGATPPMVHAFAITDAAGEPLVRLHRVSSRAPMPPLLVGFRMRSWQDVAFVWQRWTWGQTGDDEPRLEVVPGLMALTTLGVPPPPVEDVLASLRESLRTGLDDPRRTELDPVFEAFGPYVTALSKTSPSPEDVALVDRAIRDRRVRDLYRAPLARAFTDPTPLRGALVDRIAHSEDRSETGILNVLLDRMPAGAFAQLTPEETALLADPARRTRAQGLVARLSDQGTGGIPVLMDILETHLPLARDDLKAHEDAIDGVRMGLCRLGPDAGRVRERIETLSTDGSLPKAIARRPSWLAMRVRLGTPIEQVVTPDVADDVDQTMDRVERRLKRIAAGEDCGWG